MIESLRIRNVGGVRSAELEFRGRFVAVTGESGAGKSSLVRALELLAGKRAQGTILRAGEDAAEVEGTFLPGPDERDREPLRVRRVLSKTGKNRLYLQDEWATLADLGRTLSPRLQIQSQFAQLELLDPQEARDLLDAFAGPETESRRGTMETLYRDALGQERRLRDLKVRRRDVLATFAPAEAAAQEIRGLPLAPGCARTWEEERIRLQEGVAGLRALSQQTFLLAGDDQGLLLQLRRCIDLLTAHAPEEDRALWSSLAAEGLEKLEMLAGRCEKALLARSPEAEEAALEELETRLGTLKGLLRRLRLKDEAALLAYLEEARTQEAWLHESESLLADLETQVRQLRREANRAALDLREHRTASARLLGEEVQRHLGELGMEGFAFQVHLSPLDRLHPWGADQVEFLLGTGELPPAPIPKRASGGELSRILLALQCAIRDRRTPATLVFDEVEAGLGGKAALLAGLKLRELARSGQVILVTHEASLAALADQHFLVHREGDRTLVEDLRGEPREREIARMLSGSEDVPEALEHARVLLRCPRPEEN
ncbi:SMC domain protein [Aminomonas paucivorans DSM 12260]|uniref:DNA repair protein RecN n=1 Tax=Aminomonas paucivorans DSM 12260 TaxID=584708 RepID=E3D0Q8_9BACT|nr:AAA family ATPase [Aminomonas paucivorans]EFQ23879.1 SMC domain protein [Aminomonas paucivorans DSM 12260]